MSKNVTYEKVNKVQNQSIENCNKLPRGIKGDLAKWSDRHTI